MAENPGLVSWQGGVSADILPDSNPRVQPPVLMDVPGMTFPEEVMGMIRKVLVSGNATRSQQRGDPELTETQKTEYLSDLLSQHPCVFLKRYGPLLSETDLSYFEGLGRGQYEIQFRVQELRKSLKPRAKQTRVRNRRFEHLRELVETTQYFSEEEMRSRNPLLYEHYIGQYLTEEEREALDRDRSDMSLSGHIMRKMEMDRRTETLRLQRQRETDQLEESDTSSEGEEEEEEGDTKRYTSGLGLSGNPEVAARERAMLRVEFLREMQLSFLNGEDKEFDYTKVDLDERYDPVDLRQRDDEDSYFDAEEPGWCEEPQTTGAATEAGGAMDTGDGSDTENDYMSEKYLQPEVTR